MDGDGICDENDPILGCTDLIACNYCEGCVTDNTMCVYPNNCTDCGEVTQAISLPTGWSLFSTYLCPTNPSIDSVMVSVVNNENLVIVKDQDGLVYWPQFSINQIGEMVNGGAYLAKVNIETVFNVSGSLLGYDYPLNIGEGWSYLGYLHQDSYPIEDMLETISSEILIVKNSQGNVYWPQFDLNTIEIMNPGEGYQINLFNESDFSYPWLGVDGRYVQSEDLTIYSSRFNKPKNTGNNMTIGIPEKAWHIKPNIDDEILVYNQNNLLVGKSKYREDFTAITIWGDDEITRDKDGLSIGEAFIIKLYQNQEDIVDTFEVTHWEQGGHLYSIDGISVVGSLISNNYKQDELIRVTDILGRDINANTKKATLLHIYNNGNVERKYVIE